MECLAWMGAIIKEPLWVLMISLGSKAPIYIKKRYIRPNRGSRPYLQYSNYPSDCGEQALGGNEGEILERLVLCPIGVICGLCDRS